MGERQFGPYRLVQQIAVGGMAEIHLAKTSGIAGFEKYVALKMIHPNFSQDEQFIQMLIDEAKITVQLQHVNIAQTFDLGRVGETYYITMEFVDGADLYKLLRRSSERDQAMPVDVAAYAGKEMATGLDYAHRKRDMSGRALRIVHRDVSPQNVLISHAGEVKLVDFGIAKATMRVRQTAVGVIKGKYYYMSPEQAWGDPLDHRSDIFSCGIVLYEMLTGQMLYLEEDLHRLLDMVRKANIAPPTTLRPDIPPQLERIVMHALSKRPDDRYQTAGDLATDLERFLHAYSPVFTASKVTAFFDKILGEEAEPPPPPVIEPVPEARREPDLSTQRISRDHIVRERSEFTDENSVIFRVSDLKPPEPSAPARPAHVQTMEMDGGYEEDERTVISAPPGFDSGTEDREFENTVIESDFGDEGPTMARGPKRVRTPPPDEPEQEEEAPTRLDFRPSDKRASRMPVSDGVPRPRLGQPSAAPAHPVLSANNAPPAVSELRKPRESRRTPATGLPGAGGGSDSLLSSIIGGGPSAPTAPIRGGGSGVPRSIIPAESAQHPGGHVLPVPGPGSNSPTSPRQRPPTGFPLAAPQTPNPTVGFPVQPHPTEAPFSSPFPTGQPPSSLTRQLAALEIDEIPSQYKLSRRSGARWLLVGAVGATLVALGVVIFLLAGGGNQGPSTGQLRIDTLPQGARITVNGHPLADKSPAFLEDATIGKRYTVHAELAGYQPKEKVIVAVDGSDVLLFLDRIPRHLVVTSRPRADLLVDGVRVGSTPYERKYESAPEVVELRLKGYKPTRKTLKWGDKEELILRIVMEKK